MTLCLSFANFKLTSVPHASGSGRGSQARSLTNSEWDNINPKRTFIHAIHVVTAGLVVSMYNNNASVFDLYVFFHGPRTYSVKRVTSEALIIIFLWHFTDWPAALTRLARTSTHGLDNMAAGRRGSIIVARQAAWHSGGEARARRRVPGPHETIPRCNRF